MITATIRLIVFSAEAAGATLPGGPGMQLNAALNKLARNPRDVDALIEAGKASAAIGDAEAAMGFYRRADQLQPTNANIKAGLAGAMVMAEDPYGAIPLFEAAIVMVWGGARAWGSAGGRGSACVRRLRAPK